MDRHKYLIIRRKPVMQRQPPRTKRIMEKHERRPRRRRERGACFRPRTLMVSSLQFAISNSSLKCCTVYSIHDSRGNGNPGSLEFKQFNLDARVREHDALYSQLIRCHPFAAGASTLISRSFGMTFRQTASCSSPCTRAARCRRRNLRSASRIRPSSHILRAADALSPGCRR